MTHRLPPLGALRAFEAAARLGRMTAAAEELCVSPGAAREGCDLLITALAPPDAQAPGRTHDANDAHHASEAGTGLPLFDEHLGPVMAPSMAARTGLPHLWEDLPACPCCRRARGAMPGTCGPLPDRLHLCRRRCGQRHAVRARRPGRSRGGPAAPIPAGASPRCSRPGHATTGSAGTG